MNVLTPAEKKRIRAQRNAVRMKLRYQTDPVYRQHVLDLNKRYRAKHPEKHRARAKQQRMGPMRETILAKKSEWGKKQKELNPNYRRSYFTRPDILARKSEYDRKRRESKAAELAAQQKAWREDNRDRINAICRTKRKINPQYALKNNLRCRMNAALRNIGLKRDKPLEALIGCTIQELCAHLESKFTDGMTWANRGHTGRVWQIDHIRPCASFDLTDPVQRAACFHYTNLQPLWAFDNLSKGAKVLESECPVRPALVA